MSILLFKPLLEVAAKCEALVSSYAHGLESTCLFGSLYFSINDELRSLLANFNDLALATIGDRATISKATAAL